MHAVPTTELYFNETHHPNGCEDYHRACTLRDMCKDSVPEMFGGGSVYNTIHKWMQSDVAATADVASSGLSHIAILPNAEALDVYEMPHGIALTVGAKTPLNAEWLKRPPVRATVVCPVIDASVEKCSDAYYANPERRQALQQQVAECSAVPLSEASLAAENGKRDAEHWEAALGEGAGQSWVGVYRDGMATIMYQSGRQQQHARHNGKATQPLFVVASCTAPRAMHKETRAKWHHKLVEEEEEKDSTTPTLVGDRAFLDDEERLAQAAYRNACRLAYQAAEALALDINSSIDEQSVYATPEQRQHYTPPRMARPDHVQVANMAAPLNGARTLVGIDSGCASFASAHPYNCAMRHQGGIHNTHAVLAYGPQQGMALAPLAVECLKKSHVQPVVAPVGSRRCMLQEEAERYVEKDRQAKSFPMPTNYVWEGQDDKGKEQAVRTRFLPQRYEKPGARFNMQMSALDQEHEVRYLDPVLVKVALPHHHASQ